MVDHEDWRTEQALKLLRQCVTCPLCGASVCTARGIETHRAWHQTTGQYVSNVDDKFNVIDQYVRGEGGLEDQITAEFADVRADATAAITTLRSDATTAIQNLASRVSTIEQELTRAETGVLARLNALEQL
jgi:hypothetical protein